MREHLAVSSAAHMGDVELGDEAGRLDGSLASPPMSLDVGARAGIWGSASALLSHGPLAQGGLEGATGLALGYVQSGKTTSITALLALAADDGYRLMVALLGTTNLLLDQNTARIQGALVGDRVDYRWVTLPNPKGRQAATKLADWLDRGRVLLVPVLKHAGRLNALADALAEAGAERTPTIIIDDEADQASLNTKVRAQDESETFAAIQRVRAAVPNHLYVQYTATPYAPLLLEPDDHLSPDFVEMLNPGPGYTGGREFFIDNADRVVRPIPTLDEQAPRGLPTGLPASLVDALGSFVAGTAMLLGNALDTAPVSMLIHSTHKNDVQARYQFLLERRLRQWKQQAEDAERADALPPEIVAERGRLLRAGARDLPDDAFIEQVRFTLRESTVWLVNSASDVKKIDWRVAPVHILIGGNKLDRGFTVEGLTVTYMNRPASPQVDTLEQRARAFGYRQDLLPYCQFFATPRTLETLRGTVFTEYDLRAELEDWLDGGGSVADWARHVGMMLPAGTRPTRDAVLTAVERFNVGAEWHSLRRPDLSEGTRQRNRSLVEAVGLLDAPERSFGRLGHRVVDVQLRDVRERLLEPWQLASYSPGWRHDDILQYLSRLDDQAQTVPVVLMQQPEGGPRERRWDDELGFVNLFQGPDVIERAGADFYRGDRNLFDFDREPTKIVFQVHRVHPRGVDIDEVLTLAARLGTNVVVRRGT
jgi:hypothetical protein